ncbi:hypothetical protein [Bosea rubneri]|uniref:Uncharacterized protein n=1 Tax=Bosea rubneri TaxID=3075434 RepID=A0ABU3SFY9_9HYPH|nr:hypothetical protein [Bosea sp. ZW T0_25]MDU0343697.1 hypothetical protein [Bosea sp. ZW T0_25]
MITAHNDNIRTPEQHRAEVEKWRKTAPATDGAIWGRAAKPKSPRHADLADEFHPILTWIALWEAVEADPVSSNWMASPDLVYEAGNEDEEDAYIAPSNEGDEANWLPKTDTAADRLLVKMLDGVETREMPETILRDGKRETRTRRVIVGGDIERSKDSGRVVRAGDFVFNDGPAFNYVSAPIRKLDEGEDDECAELDFDASKAPHEMDDAAANDNEPKDAAAEHDNTGGKEQFWDRSVCAGSVRGFRHTFWEKNRAVNTTVVPFKSKLRFTDRKSPPPPVREILTVAQRREAREIMSFALNRLKPATVMVLDEYRAKSFEAIGEMLGKTAKTAERLGQEALRDACAELAAVLTEYEKISARDIPRKELREAA